MFVLFFGLNQKKEPKKNSRLGKKQPLPVSKHYKLGDLLHLHFVASKFA